MPHFHQYLQIKTFMKKLRIVFMGTPEFAVKTLNQILIAGFEVAGVITAPDKPSGRGRKLQQSAVKLFAEEKGINVLQPTNLKSPEFINELKILNPNVQVVVAFRMLPKVVWQLPELGTFNLHASLLPQYRGAAPINWALINGETSTGVSTFFIDEKIDTGEMILQKEVKIGKEENVEALHDKLMTLGAGLVVETLKLIQSGQVETIKQEESPQLKEAPKLDKDNTRILWEKTSNDILNFIRGLDPYPGAWSWFENGNDERLQMKIYKANVEQDSHKIATGTILLEVKSLKVAVSDGFVHLLEIQLPGKRKMKTAELLNGFQFKNEAKMF